MNFNKRHLAQDEEELPGDQDRGTGWSWAFPWLLSTNISQRALTWDWSALPCCFLSECFWTGLPASWAVGFHLQFVIAAQMHQGRGMCTWEYVFMESECVSDQGSGVCACVCVFCASAVGTGTGRAWSPHGETIMKTFSEVLLCSRSRGVNTDFIKTVS